MSDNKSWWKPILVVEGTASDRVTHACNRGISCWKKSHLILSSIIFIVNETPSSINLQSKKNLRLFSGLFSFNGYFFSASAIAVKQSKWLKSFWWQGSLPDISISLQSPDPKENSDPHLPLQGKGTSEVPNTTGQPKHGLTQILLYLHWYKSHAVNLLPLPWVIKINAGTK